MEESSDDGKVQVFARIRPTSHVDVAPAVQTHAATQAVQVLMSSDSVEAVDAHEFRFDGVFNGQATQGDVFECVGAPVLRGFLRGLNGTILAYGQTGSGKTHSLLNPGQKNADAGLLPRLVSDLFGALASDRPNEYRVEAAAMQVYNEQLDDLLHQRHQAGEGHEIHVQNGGIVPDLTWLKCRDAKELIKVFSRARASLIYAETKMNKSSSRSHAIFQIRLTRNIGSDRSCTCARLSVVDLAGSERIKKSGVEGAHFKEATAINKSLLALGNVVSALAARKAHVPFRDSNLTRILDGSLGGNCKTALLVCASPAQEHIHETLCSLEFASRAMNIEVHARVNRVVSVHADYVRSQIEVDEKIEKEDIATQIENAHKALSDVTLRAELAEARAAAAEEAIATRDREAKAMESTLQAESKTSSDYAARLEAELAKEKRLSAESLARIKKQAEEAKDISERLEMKLANCTKELQVRSEELRLRSAELEEAKNALKKREAEIAELRCTHRAEITDLRGELRGAESRVEVAEKMVLDARLETEEAIAQAQKASETLEADFVTEERQRLENQYKAALESQKMDLEARLQAGLKSMEAQLSDARRRSEAELDRRFVLVEGREQDAQKIVHLQEQVDKQLRDLEFRRREVDSLRRRLHKHETGGRSHARTDSSGSSSRCSSAPITPQNVPKEDELCRIESNSKQRLVPLALHSSAEKLARPRPWDSTKCLPALTTKLSPIPSVMRSIRSDRGLS